MPFITSQSFNRAERLLGSNVMETLHSINVIIFGVGGVGSWCAESLVRTGVCHITLVDADIVARSNINRQAMATVSTVGLPKAEAMAQKLRDINPDAEITAIQGLYNSETAASFNLDSYDYIIDAIDSLADKALLILNATSTKRKFFSSMGAALKSDPTRIEVAEFWKVSGCPLAAALRRRFKKSGNMPRRKFKCVYSPELLENKDVAEDTSGAMSFNKVAINGALCQVTATFGLTLASLVVNDIFSRLK
ncbi:MAG: tRNA threonylcarbamoyladenosine dehydratase [Paramuribaculum sp.]|nr:tRNA threonylcarbamoyladenosine dehydratase [Paramuribaculum sp.]